MPVQVRLQSGDDEGGITELTCLLDKKVRIGNLITLKNYPEPDRWWKVIWVGEAQKGSHDWRVGGL